MRPATDSRLTQRQTSAVLTEMAMPKGTPKRWRKICEGRNYYFRGDYATALAAWEAKKVELDNAGRSPLSSVEIMQVHAARLVNRARELAGIRDEREAAAVLSELCGESGATVRNIKQAVEQFLARRAIKVASGTQSAGYYANLQRSLDDFAAFVGRNLGVDRINGQVWESYCTKLLERKAAGLSAEYVRTYQGAVKTFIRWAWRVELLKNMPRNLDDRSLAIGTPAKKSKVFSVAEIKTLLANSHKRTRLFLLLALNCGFTQKDVSDLKKSEVDWKGGRINPQAQQDKERRRRADRRISAVAGND